MTQGSLPWISAVFSLALLLGCSSGDAGGQSGTVNATEIPEITDATSRSAVGPISEACLFHARPGASRARCTCVQAAANLTLGPSDQARGARYFGNSDALQETRQSDAPGDERFWEAWKVFAQTAEELCTA